MKIKLMALGGVEESGKNSYIIESEKDIIIIDKGSKKFDNLTLGVDTVINSIDYLVKNKDKIRGILISHSHSDNAGGLEYLIKKIPVTIYGSDYTIEFLKNEMKYDKFSVIKPNENFKLGDFVVENFNLSHSVFGHLGFLIALKNDAIVYTTDYNFKQTSKESTRTDVNKIINLKNKYNIKVLLTESKNINKSGVASGDLSFMPKFKRLAENIEGKLFISLYANNISGMVNIIDVAEEYKKKIVIIGKELLTYVNVSKKLGYIDHKTDMFIKIKDISKYKDNQIIVVVSGEYMEPFETLVQLSQKNHPITTIGENDTVMIASEAHDEIEGMVQKTLDKISRTKCTIKHLSVDIPAHAHQEDVKMMINLFEPQYIVPINGEYRKLKKTQQVAQEIGYSEDKVKIISNGDLLKLDDKSLNIIDKIKVEAKLINNDSKETINPLLLHDREAITQEGYVLITLVVDKKSKRLVQDPEILSGGLMSFDNDEPLIEKCVEIVKKELKGTLASEGLIKSKNKIKRLLSNKIGKMPVILTVKIEVK